ncbi:MAG: DUF1499 domain-containing protein [Desulfobacter sp.]
MKQLILIFTAAALAMITGCSSAPVTGVVSGKGLHPCPGSPNCVSSQSGNDTQRIDPLVYEGTREKALERLRAIVVDMGNARIVSDESDYLHAEFKSKWFRFIDDVEFWFPESDGQGSGQGIIHIRSASRVGYSDLGVNRERMEQIRTLFRKSGASM